jgi:hypothetical protein
MNAAIPQWDKSKADWYTDESQMKHNGYTRSDLCFHIRLESLQLWLFGNHFYG